MIQPRRMNGNVLSRVSTSFEKRFKRRPTGVVSKNAIGKRRTSRTRRSCSTIAAWRTARASNAEAPITNNAEQINGYVGTDIHHLNDDRWGSSGQWKRKRYRGGITTSSKDSFSSILDGTDINLSLKMKEYRTYLLRCFDYAQLSNR